MDIVRRDLAYSLLPHHTERRKNMKKIKIISVAILLSGCMAWIGCNDPDDRSRGAPNNPQGPSGPSDAQKKAPR